HFGLYVKLFKEFGKSKLKKALNIALGKPEEWRLKYFLGVLAKERKLKTKQRMHSLPKVSKDNTTSLKYLKLRALLIRKMTPKYERISKTRSRLYVKLAKEERKLKRKRNAL
ncbi:MAG: hypothetical protein ACK4NX_01660, partial [Candidatus Paceibacteria bacterium]